MKKKTAITLVTAGAVLAAFLTFDHFFGGMRSPEVIRKLQGMRLAAALFRQAKGHPPAGIDELIRNGNLEEVFELKLKPHPASSNVRNAASADVLDTGGWGYVNDPASAEFGTVFIDCSHKDEKGRGWSRF